MVPRSAPRPGVDLFLVSRVLAGAGPPSLKYKRGPRWVGVRLEDRRELLLGLRRGLGSGVTRLLIPVLASGRRRNPSSLWGYRRQAPCSRLGHPWPQKRVQEKFLETHQKQE